jgi:hypothetical protein
VADSPRIFSDLRGVRYGEVFLAFLEDTPVIEVYNSSFLNECPDELWEALDAAQLAKENGATLAVLNGPRYWMMDGMGKIAAIEPIIRSFGGIDMRRVATLEVDGNFGPAFYTERHVNRSAVWHFDAGKPVYELHAANGNAYVLQAYCVGVDPSLNQTSLSSLGEKLALPDSWSFHTRILENELIVDTTQRPATVLQDELQNTYSLVG